jgi:hypothetical protein
MRKLFTFSALSALALAGTAAAASSPSISITLKPNKVKKNSTLTVNASGFPTETSLPTSIDFHVQKGFKTSVKSVSQLCNPSASSCPTASKIGSGTAQATGTIAGVSVNDTVNFTLFLGTPRQAGDVASVILTGSDTVLHQTASGSGRLFKDSSGGLELLFDKFPTVVGLPAGTQITLDSLSLTAGAKRTVKKKKTIHHKKVTVSTTYSLITNPSTCSGSWTGSATVTFPSGPITVPLSTPCSK